MPNASWARFGSPLEAFDFYLAHGYRPIPARPRTKEPAIRWGGRYRSDGPRRMLERMPGANIAVILGDGLLDCEGDTPRANEIIADLCRGHSHPVFRSNKSIHRIFKCPDPHLTVLKHAGVEFRGCRHISVVPPSVHPSGASYEWLTDPAMPPPDMPLPLAEWYWERRPRGWGQSHAGKARPWCDGCGKRHSLPRERFDLEVEAFRKHSQPWQCHACREVDIRDICRFLKASRR